MEVKVPSIRSPASVPRKTVLRVQPQSGEGYGSSVPETTLAEMRTKEMDSTFGEVGVIPDGARGSVGSGARARGIMTTSPKAVSLPARSVKVMLPLRPVSTLVYSPVHSPANRSISLVAPATCTGEGLAAHAAVSDTSAAIVMTRMRPPVVDVETMDRGRRELRLTSGARGTA
ncbi:MAG: hypothetical protein ABS52_05560 [Gemmatimonadetes bacterium SCN 70-22]|nr:MAG: hypothetical protein ABS52_05560 [Gemmatimonadetes bacterium SCN 70-22]